MITTTLCWDWESHDHYCLAEYDADSLAECYLVWERASYYDDAGNKFLKAVNKF
jgi:hypothetical protein